MSAIGLQRKVRQQIASDVDAVQCLRRPKSIPLHPGLAVRTNGRVWIERIKESDHRTESKYCDNESTTTISARVGSDDLLGRYRDPFLAVRGQKI